MAHCTRVIFPNVRYEQWRQLSELILDRPGVHFRTLLSADLEDRWSRSRPCDLLPSWIVSVNGFYAVDVLPARMASIAIFEWPVIGSDDGYDVDILAIEQLR